MNLVEFVCALNFSLIPFRERGLGHKKFAVPAAWGGVLVTEKYCSLLRAESQRNNLYLPRAAVFAGQCGNRSLGDERWIK